MLTDKSLMRRKSTLAKLPPPRTPFRVPRRRCRQQVQPAGGSCQLTRFWHTIPRGIRPKRLHTDKAKRTDARGPISWNNGIDALRLPCHCEELRLLRSESRTTKQSRFCRTMWWFGLDSGIVGSAAGPLRSASGCSHPAQEQHASQDGGLSSLVRVYSQ